MRRVAGRLFQRRSHVAVAVAHISDLIEDASRTAVRLPGLVLHAAEAVERVGELDARLRVILDRDRVQAEVLVGRIDRAVLLANETQPRHDVVHPRRIIIIDLPGVGIDHVAQPQIGRHGPGGPVGVVLFHRGRKAKTEGENGTGPIWQVTQFTTSPIFT